MATTIYFNGRTTAIPGSYSEVDASGLARVGLGATGILAILGEAEGGAPGITRISNPGKIGRTFQDGDLLEAGNMAFDPSLDPNIPGGAQEVYFVKVNPATQSALTVANGDGDSMVLTSTDYGLFTTQISWEQTDGTVQGKAFTLTFGDLEEAFDDVGGDGIFSMLYTPGATGADTMAAVADPDGTYALVASYTKAESGLVADYVGTIDSIAGLDSDQVNPVTPAGVVEIFSSSSADTTQSVTVYGIDNGSGLPASEVIALDGSDGTTVVIGSTAWDRIHGVLLDATTAGNVSVRNSPGGTVIHVIASGSLSKGLYVFSDPIENRKVLELFADGAATDEVLVIGTTIAAAPQLEEVTLSGTTPVPTSAAFGSIVALGLGLAQAARQHTVEGLLWNSGDVVSAVSSSPADTGTLTVYGLDTGGDAQTESFALTGTSLASGTATWSRVLGSTLDGVPVGTVTVQGTTETVEVFSMTGTEAGFVVVDNVKMAASVATLVATAGVTDIVLLVGLDENNQPQAEKFQLTAAIDVLGTLLWNEITGLAIAHVAAASTVTASGDSFRFTPVTTVREAADVVNAASGWTFTEITAKATTFLLSQLDDTASVTVLSTATFGAVLDAMITAINDGASLATAARATGATGAPDNTASPLFLTGGIEGATAFADWQAGIDLLRDQRVNTLIPLTDDEAVHAATTAHCRYMAGPGRSERDCILGEESGISLSDAKDAAKALNTRHARMVIQDIERFNVAGEREVFPPYFAAVIAGGMQAGSSVGTSLTHKFLNILGFEGDDDTYTVVDDANELIQAGLCMIEDVPNVGSRWLRNITTYLIDNNLAYIEASTNEAVNFSVYEFRSAMEFAVGQPGFAGTVNAGISVGTAILGLLIDSGAITTWQNLSISIEGDVMEVDVELAPIVPVNFVKNTIHLISASFSAAA